MGGGTLLGHVNYEQGEPLPYETPIQFALREAAMLLSPPMEKGESHEIECVSAAQEIRDLAPKLQKVWDTKYKSVRAEIMENALTSPYKI